MKRNLWFARAWVLVDDGGLSKKPINFNGFIRVLIIVLRDNRLKIHFTCLVRESNLWGASGLTLSLRLGVPNGLKTVVVGLVPIAYW